MPGAAGEPDSASALIERGRALNDARRFRDAVPLLRQAVVAAPHDSTPYRLLSWALLHLDEPQEALREVERAIAIDPENGFGHRNRALILHALKRWPEALNSAREAVRLAPREAVTLHTLVESELNCGRINEAFATADRLRELSPSWFYTHDVLALVHWHRKDWAAMESAARKALELDPEASTSMYFLGMAQLNQKRREEAIQTLYEAARLDPTNAKIRRQLQALVDEHTTGVGIFLAALLLALICGPGIARSYPSLNPVLLTLACVLFVAGSFVLATFFQKCRLKKLTTPVAAFYESEAERAHRPLRALTAWMVALVGSIAGGVVALGELGDAQRAGRPTPWYALPLAIVALACFIGILAVLRRQDQSGNTTSRGGKNR